MKTIYRDNNENRLDVASIDWLKVQATVTSYDAVNQVQHVKVLRWDDVFQGQPMETSLSKHARELYAGGPLTAYFTKDGVEWRP